MNVSFTKSLCALIALGALFTIGACKKKVSGCMEPQALNYDRDADDEGDCTYTSAIFRVQDGFMFDSSVVTVELDGNSVGTVTVTDNDPVKILKTALADGDWHSVSGVIKGYQPGNDSVAIIQSVVLDPIRAESNKASVMVNIQ